MTTTVTLDKKHYRAVTQKARKLGTTPEDYVQSLIDADELSMDELLAPVRKAFAESGVTEDELDQVVADARKAIWRRNHRRASK